ncbi:hypothetical protein AL065_28985 [Pseudomonas amygdali pv. ulmi]|nr:hypothetical protein AL065_28985 [Pseudomonas amygdali pv. ulmi]
MRLQLGPGHQLFKVSQEAISASLLFLAGIFEFGEGFLHARNAHGEGGWLKELSVPRVGTVGYFCSASLVVMSIYWLYLTPPRAAAIFKLSWVRQNFVELGGIAIR